MIRELTEELAAAAANRGKPRAVPETEAKIERDRTTIRLYLNLSQQDRAIVSAFGLDEIAYEDEPLYSREALDRKRQEFDQELATVTDANRRAELRLFQADTLKGLQTRRVKRGLSDYLAYPYERIFETAYEATEYSNTLEKIVRKIHADIESYRSKIQNRVVSFRP